ncbi:MAG: PKD domain-containing protein, partial [Anaerolineae bacterium]
MDKKAILAQGALMVGAMFIGLLVVAGTLAAPLSPDTSLGQADASFLGEDWGDRSGSRVSGAGDVNGDGYGDFLIGAPYDEEGGNEAGQSYLILGKSGGWAMDTGLNLANASFRGEDDGDQAGSSIARAGDVNGDGYDDFLIGAPYDEEVHGAETGQTYLILGKPSGWAMDTNLDGVDASFLGEDGGDRAGYSVAGAGDVNGDGYDDILIGAPYDEYGEDQAGQTYLILGKPGGWSKDTGLGSADASFVGEQAGGQSGFSVAMVGDVNGDGYDDFIIGAPYFDNGANTDVGKTYLILGRQQANWGMNFNLSNADASFLGQNAGDVSGYSVAGAGDVNDDGYDDFLIGAWMNDAGGGNAGKTYLILGRQQADWDSFNLVNADASFRGEIGSDWSGWSIAGAGDVNNDGCDDFIIGAYGNDAGGSLAGQSYLILGRGAANWGSDFNLANADASFWGEDTYDYAGYSVSGAGDVNGDGYDDFLIGARNDEDGGSQAGQTYLILGNGLKLSKVASDSPEAGRLFTYTISYSNTAYITANNVIITDYVPANTTYVDCAGGLSCSESGGLVTWDVGNVISRNEGAVTLTVQVNSGFCEDIVITNTTYLTSTNIFNSLAATLTNTVVVTPTANFTSNTPVCLGTPMFFTDTGQCAVAWLWDFGDGLGTSNVQNPVYTYTVAGAYTVALTVTNASGHSNSYQEPVTVNEVPVASFTSNSPVCLGEMVTFTNTSVGAESYLWDFGDGQSSVESEPEHIYGSSGAYTVVLTATSSAGCFNVFTDTVTVNEVPVASFTSNSPV